MCAGGEIPALISVPAFCALMFLSTCRTREADSLDSAVTSGDGSKYFGE